MSAPVHAIAVFSGRRDTLLATPIAWQLKMNQQDCRVVWYTTVEAAVVLENNPHVDEVVILEGTQEELDEQISELRAERDWDRFITPSPYLHREEFPDYSEVDLVREGAKIDWIIPFRPVLRLTIAEQQQARRYWQRLPAGPKILVEELGARSSFWRQEFRDDLISAFKDLDPTFIFLGEGQIPGLDEFAERWPKTVWCREPFRLSAEFINHCDAIIGVGADYSTLAYADCCRRDTPQVEVVLGQPWSGISYTHKENVYNCFAESRYQEAIHALAKRLEGNFHPDFSPRHVASAPRESCPSCGSSTEASRGLAEDAFRQCRECRLVFQPRPPVNVRAVVSSADQARREALRAEHFRGAVDAWSGQPRGARAFVVDANPSALVQVGHNLGMKVQAVHPDEFMQANLAEGIADLVFLPHCLQEQAHPQEYIEKADYLLRQAGLLYLTVPNIGGLGHGTFGAQWHWFGKDRFPCHLPVGYLSKGLSALGLSVEQADSMPGEFPGEELKAIYRHLRPNMSDEVLPHMVKAVSAQSGGEELRVMARKRGFSKARALVQ